MTTRDGDDPALGMDEPITKTGIVLKRGQNVRDGKTHEEYHAPCGCAFHEYPHWHWHPCDEHSSALRFRQQGPDLALSMEEVKTCAFCAAPATIHSERNVSCSNSWCFMRSRLVDRADWNRRFGQQVTCFKCGLGPLFHDKGECAAAIQQDQQGQVFYGWITPEGFKWAEGREPEQFTKWIAAWSPGPR